MIVVTINNGNTGKTEQRFETASEWSADASGGLTIFGSDGVQLGYFAPGKFNHVIKN